VLTEKTKLNFDKKKKKEHCIEHRTAANPPQKPTHEKPNGGGYAAVQTFGATKKKCRSSIKQKEVD
jgi:hypothetical protein